MEKNCDMTGEIGNHQPTKQPREDQSSSESQPPSGSPVAANPMPKGTNWVDLFVKEITSASDSDDARNRAAKALKSFEATIRARSFRNVTKYLLERAKKIGTYEGPLDQRSIDFIWENGDMSYFLGPDGKANPVAFFNIDFIGDSDDEDEDPMIKQEEDKSDENGRTDARA